MKTTNEILQTSLGTVYVQPAGDVPPSLTLHAVETVRFGVMLMDVDGKHVNPKSQRLGYHGRRGSSNMQLVCDDDVSEETEKLLRERGYFNVTRRG